MVSNDVRDKDCSLSDTLACAVGCCAICRVSSDLVLFVGQFAGVGGTDPSAVPVDGGWGRRQAGDAFGVGSRDIARALGDVTGGGPGGGGGSGIPDSHRPAIEFANDTAFSVNLFEELGLMSPVDAALLAAGGINCVFCEAL